MPPSRRVAPDRRRRDLQVLAEIAALSTRDEPILKILEAAAARIRDAYGFVAVGVLIRDGEDYDLAVVAGPSDQWRSQRYDTRSVTQALRSSTAVLESLRGSGATMTPAADAGDGMAARPVPPLSGPPPDEARTAEAAPPELRAAGTAEGRAPRRPGRLVAVAAPISIGDGPPWGLLSATAAERRPIDAEDIPVLVAAAAQLGVAVSRGSLLDGLARQLRKSEALRTIAADISSKLDLPQILSGLIEYALVLFGGDRGAVLLRQPDGTLRAGAMRNLSQEYVEALREIPPQSLATDAVAARRPIYSVRYVEDPRSAPLRQAVEREGYDTACVAPLFDAGGLLGLLAVYHDAPREWSDEDLQTLGELATQASVAIRTAQNFSQMATWAAQLQSIQHLGARLSRLTMVNEIGAAIASELRQLIDYHNVRVYRIGPNRTLLPVAYHGSTYEYIGETPEALIVQWGEGITGWVAEHGIAQNLPDAARDPRTETIPGTNENIDESMLVAPMTYEGRVLGVLVLSKLGLHQFSDDDLRLLVIYASFAAQAMANADATQRLRSQTAELERQLRSQRELLQITESILSSLDTRVIVEQITDRLYELVRYDAVVVELGDRAVGDTTPVAQRLVREAPQLDVTGRPLPPANVLEVPLRGREGVTGMLRLSRWGDQPAFTEPEVELVRLFAAHVSIALQNAETHREVEVRAQTDDLTGLLNQGTFVEWLGRSVEAGERFSLIMLDLDSFKSVNDRMGHQAGDVFLQQIAGAIVGAARDTDIVFRYGGDEFAILLPRTDPEGARQVAERVQEALHGVRVGRRSRDVRGRERSSIEVSASIGIGTFPDDGSTPDEVLLAADRACYVAKRSGRSRIAMADEGRKLVEEFTLQEPTPVDEPSLRMRAAPRWRPPAE